MKKIKEKVVGDPYKIKSKVFDINPYGTVTDQNAEVMSPVMTTGELGKTASTIKASEKKK